jgi:hypothetical protein
MNINVKEKKMLKASNFQGCIGSLVKKRANPSAKL